MKMENERKQRLKQMETEHQHQMTALNNNGKVY